MTSSVISRSGRVFGGAAAAAALILGAAGAATADGPEQESISISSSSQSSAHDYWTADRMESATPAESLVPDHVELPDAAVEKGVPSKIAGAEPAAAAQTKGQGKGQGAEQEPAAAGDLSHVGKVFFTQGGVDYVCSGNVVASANGSTVATAGHCVNEGGTWVTNWVFVPGYDNGEAPYGTWTATDIVSTDQWVGSEDINYDVAFAKVESGSGSGTLESVVGTTGIAFNQERSANYTSYGYPAAAPFDGETLESCGGTATDDTLGGTMSQGIPCDMTGGSSGGPWFLDDGYQNSVNSFGYNTQPGVMYGPYYGADAQQAYQEAEVL